MPNTITATPARPDGAGLSTVPATDDAARTHHTWAWITDHINTGVLTIAGLIATVAILWYLARKAKTLATGERPDDKLATLGMVIGLGWSGEAMWVIGTKLLNVPWPVMVVLLFALEVNLSVAMIRAVRHYREHQHPGRYGQTAWLIALSIATIASFASHSLAEVALRVAVPLLVTKTWWDGLTGNETARRLAGISSWRWTPRRLLLWLGAIEPGERDVETINRERVTQQMTRLYYLSLYGWKRLQTRRRARLARLTLTADDAMIREVMRRVTRTSWTTAQPLPYDVTQPGTRADDGSDAPVAQPADAITGASDRTLRSRVTVPPARRAKTASATVTSGDARDADPATHAAQRYLAGDFDSIRKAADAVPGAKEATVRRRLKEWGDAPADAVDAPPTVRVTDVPVTHISEPAPRVTAGVNGHPHSPLGDPS
ncbi:hypothetical protein ACQP2Y_21390 [Actinoplanes sp. CA-051413]|uniref:hypothetical protein n=1 Tax=Actinoplanes sp. CA-051413 TaxID=3239899 RepID=UPI003D95C944